MTKEQIEGEIDVIDAGMSEWNNPELMRAGLELIKLNKNNPKRRAWGSGKTIVSINTL